MADTAAVRASSKASVQYASRTALLKVVILGLVWLVAFSSRLFSVVRYESIIHEFDPWFNFRTTQNLVWQGFYDFLNWFDNLSWYPLGRVVGGTVYPGLMVTSAGIYHFLHSLNIPIDIRNVCVFLAPLFSGATAIATYHFTSELKDSSAGLLAAAMIGIAPGYISRSVAGSYDNEGVAIFALQFVFWLWFRAVRTGSAMWAALTALGYFYMVSAWGGYVFIINLIPLHAFALILMGRYSSRLYVAYSTFYALGTLMSMQIPFIGFQPIQTSEHMAALGIFGIIQLIAIFELIRSHLGENQFRFLFRFLLATAFIGSLVALVILTTAGYVRPWGGRFYSLWDTGYARKYIPIIASVSEHQPTPWTSFFFDLHLLVIFFPVGVYFCFQKLEDNHIFAIIYSLFSAYFAGVMVRLMLTLTPIACAMAAIGLSTVLDTYLRDPNLDYPSAPAVEAASASSSTSGRDAAATTPKKGAKGQSAKMEGDIRFVVVLAITILLILFPLHCTFVTSTAYSSPSIVLATRNHDGSPNIIDDFREAYHWLRMNTAEDAKILSWWDYGYQLTGMANRTVLVDNNTWNNTHIATVGKAMASREEVAYEIFQKLDVDYVLVIFGGALGYSGDDINKFLWMIRIAQGVYPNDVEESSFFTQSGDYRIDKDASETMKNSLMYKLSYYRFGEYGPYNYKGRDRVRNQEVGKKNILLTHTEEAFTSEHWIVRIYKVKKPDNLGRDLRDASRYDAEYSGQIKSRSKPKTQSYGPKLATPFV